MLIKSSAKTAEIDCSWRNQFELSQKPYNGCYYDSQFWKRFPNAPLFIYSNLMRLLFYPVRKISGIKLNIFTRVS